MTVTDPSGYVIELDSNEAEAIEHYLGRSLRDYGAYRAADRPDHLAYGCLASAGLRVFDAMRQARQA